MLRYGGNRPPDKTGNPDLADQQIRALDKRRCHLRGCRIIRVPQLELKPYWSHV